MLFIPRADPVVFEFYDEASYSRDLLIGVMQEYYREVAYENDQRHDHY